MHEFLAALSDHLSAQLKDYAPVLAAAITAAGALAGVAASILVERTDKRRRHGKRRPRLNADEALHEALLLRASTAEARLAEAEQALTALRNLMDQQMSAKRRELAHLTALVFRLGYDPKTGERLRKGDDERNA